MKLSKKLIAILMAVVLAVVCVACSSGTTDKEDKKGELTADTIKIGVLHITSKDDTSGYTAAHQAGIVGMMKELNIPEENVIIKDNVADTDTTLTKQSLQELVEAECDIIFATSYNYMQPVNEFADAHPDIIFSHCSGSLSNDSNFNNYFGRINEARYLSGVVAGLKAKELNNPVLGYVAAMDDTNAEVTGGINAFLLGAQSVYPECTLKVSVTGEWYNPEKEGKSAQALIDAGCSVISQHCDSETTQTTSAKANESGKKVFGVGYNSDMVPAAPSTCLTSPIWNWNVYYTSAVQWVLDGKAWKDFGNYYEGMNKGLVDISPINEKAVADGTAEAVEEAKKGIVDGTTVIFNKDVEKADGTKLGHDLTDKEIAQEMTYYVKGVSTL